MSFSHISSTNRAGLPTGLDLSLIDQRESFQRKARSNSTDPSDQANTPTRNQ